MLLILLGWRHLAGGAPEKAPPEPRNPLQLKSAILMAVSFQVVLFVLAALTRRFGESGVLASASVFGLTDMDALTFGMNRLAEAPERIPVAALALTLGVTVNGAFKTALTGILGAPPYRRLALPGLLVLTGAGAAGFWLLRWAGIG